jgi:argininosuccinate lyase
MKGLPMTYNRDMQEDKEPLFDAFHQTSGALAMAKVVAESVVLDPKKPAAAADESWVVATDLAEELARRGVPFHRAHQLVGKLVLDSIRANKKPSDWTGAALATFAPEFSADMARLFEPGEGMKTREVPGGTGPASVGKALDDAEIRLDTMRRALG